MIYEFYEALDDESALEFLKEMLPFLEKEMDFWYNRRRIEIKNTKKEEYFEPYIYESESDEPRPESLREDLETAKNLSYFVQKNIYRVNFFILNIFKKINLIFTKIVFSKNLHFSNIFLFYYIIIKKILNN